MRNQYAATIIFLLLLFMYCPAGAQSLTLDELMTLREKSLNDFGNYLESKGWVFDNAGEGYAGWAYDRNNNGTRLSDCMLFWGENAGKSIVYQTSNIVFFNRIQERMKLLGFKKPISNADNNGVTNSYFNGAYFLSLKREHSPDSKLTMYKVVLMDKDNLVQILQKPSESYLYQTTTRQASISVRKEAHIDAEEIGIIPLNATIYVLERTNENYYLVVSDGKKGYVSSNYLAKP